MTTNAFVGRAFLYRGDGGSPEAYTKICAVFAMSGLGQTNEQIDATTFCSNGSKEYIAGLADGSEVTFELNFETVDPTKTIIQSMITDVKNKAIRAFEIRVDGNNDGNENDFIFTFTGTCLSWTFNPSPSAKNSISFTIKISGDIVITAA